VDAVPLGGQWAARQPRAVGPYQLQARIRLVCSCYGRLSLLG